MFSCVSVFGMVLSISIFVDSVLTEKKAKKPGLFASLICSGKTKAVKKNKSLEKIIKQKYIFIFLILTIKI